MLKKVFALILFALLAMPSLAAQIVPKDFTALDEAVQGKDFAGFKRLMASAFAVTDLNAQRYTPIQWLSGSAPLDFIQYLVSLGADINAPVKANDDAKAWDFGMVGDTPLEVAASGGNLEVLKYYQSKGAIVGSKAMFSAVVGGRLSMVQYLFPFLPKTAINGSPDGTTYLDICTSYDDPQHQAVSLWLIEHGIDLNASKGGSYDMVHQLAMGKQLAVFKAILSRNVDWNLKTQWGATPIFQAVESSVNITRELLKKKVSLEGIEQYHRLTLLQTAVAAGNPYTSQLLITAGADPDFKNPQLENKSAIDLAREKGFGYLIPILRKQATIAMPPWSLDDEIKTGLQAVFSDRGELRLTDLQGTASKLADLRGNLVVLNIWASWCPPCVQEMPSLQALGAAYQARGVKIAGLSIDKRVSEAADFVKKHGINFSIYHDDQDWVAYKSNYYAQQYPTTYIVDSRGLTACSIVGSRDWANPDVKRYIDMVLALPKGPAGSTASDSTRGNPGEAAPKDGIDAVFNLSGKFLYFFQGSLYFKWDIIKQKTTAAAPRQIAAGWPGIDYQQIDAVLDQGNDIILFFSGDSFSAFDVAKDRATGTKGSLKKWKGMPFSRIDAAYNNGDGKAYLIQGGQYVRVSTADWSVDPGYPKPLTLYRGLPWAKVDEAFKLGHSVYFFSGDSFLQYDIDGNMIMPGAPQRISLGFPGIDFSH